MEETNEAKSTAEYLEELELPDLDDQEITVEMVVQKVSDEENDDDDDDDDDDREEENEREKITIQLNSSSAPVTAANFVNLVEQDFYDSLAFHRFVEGFVIQGGDPESRNIKVSMEDLGTGGYIDPETDEEREIPLEIKVAATEKIVYNELVDEPVALSHEAGVIAMARSQALDTASSQFYFAVDDISDQLDGGYAVFGEVTENFDFVEEIREGDRILVARVVDGNIPSRTSEIIKDSDLLNDWANSDNKAKVSYVENKAEISYVTNGDETRILGLLEDNLIPSLTPDLEELPNNDDNSETEGGKQENDESEEVASGDENDNSEETEELQASQTETLLDIDVVDSSFTTILGTEDDDVIDVLEITDADPDSSFAIMGLTGDDEISGGNANDILSGNEGNDSITGRDGQDFLRGGKGDDILTGGKGNDYLIGDYGNDILTGGLGADSFILRADAMGETAITDFSLAEEDQIIIIAEFTSDEGNVYELVDVNGDAEIRLIDSSSVLGIVEGTAIEDVENNIFAVNPDDYALRLG
ncbi:MAG: peptidylprolyl isomerase [Trichodesmium sp.]